MKELKTADGIIYEEAVLLMKKAQEARRNAYTPYSHFAVGAALLGSDDVIYTGCNVENAAYSPGNCAERTAVFKAVSEGCQSFTAIAVVGAKEGDVPEGRAGETMADTRKENDVTGTICSPCGVCRQVLREFCDVKTFRVYLTDGVRLLCYTLEELLPLSFGPENL